MTLLFAKITYSFMINNNNHILMVKGENYGRSNEKIKRQNGGNYKQVT